MLKRILLAAVLAVPSLAFAWDGVVIRVNTPQRDFHEYRPHAYQSGRDNHDRMTRWVNEEQERQRDRIAQGIRSGELTWREAERLLREQAQIRAAEQHYLADRRFTPWEFDRLQDELREASRNIRAQKSDRE